MKQAIVFTLFCSISLALAVGPGVTVKVEPVKSGTSTRLAVPGHAPAVPSPVSKLQPLPQDSGWTLMDSLVLHSMIPAGDRLAVVFDSATESLRDTLLPDFLTDSSKMAVAIAPDWLKDDLADNLRRLGSNQNRMAAVILNCPDKRYYDEICFEVAHLSPVTLNAIDPQILVDNVQQMYEIAPYLHYVEIVDYGDPLQGGNYYSTTRYRAIENGETTMVEIPRDIYYWWIVMPKGTDEEPEYVYDSFWRDYLFYQADSGFPVLRDKLANTQVLWNGQQGWWAGNGTPFDDTLPAVAVVGRWCAYGEMQDILQAAARTALIPCGGVNDINEDHVWDEIWWQGKFEEWQVDLGGGPFHQAEGVDQLRRQRSARNGKVFYGALRLWAVIGVGRQADFAQRIVLGAEVGHGGSPVKGICSISLILAPFCEIASGRYNSGGVDGGVNSGGRILSWTRFSGKSAGHGGGSRSSGSSIGWAGAGLRRC